MIIIAKDFMITMIVKDGTVVAADRAARWMVGKPVAQILVLADKAGWRITLSDDEQEQLARADAPMR